MRLCCFIFALAMAAPAEIIDRVVATVGDQVVTRSELHLNIRLRAFLNGESPVFTPDEQRAAADRLVEQSLIRHEMSLSRYPGAEMSDLERTIERLKQSRFAGDEEFQRALAEYRITEEDLREQLLWQLSVLRFIDFRFRPGVQVTEDEMRSYYNQEFLPRWKESGRGAPPSFEESREQIEEIVTAREVDAALDRWIDETRTRTIIRIRKEAIDDPAS
ncbi:MAG: hypothetical protein ACK5AZ_15345 [Bryobacteraceae bacterium]